MRSAGKYVPCRSIALAAACLLAFAACRDSGTTEDPTISLPETTAWPDSTVATTATTAATALIPLDQDPPVIDLAYAQRVLDEISRLDGEVSRILYRDRALSAEAEATLLSYLEGDALDDARQGIQNDLSVGFNSYRDPPGRPIVTARRLISSRPDCIAVQGDSDFSPRYRTPVKINRDLGIILQRNPAPTPEFHRINPSNWVQTFGGDLNSGTTLEGICR